MVAALGEHDLAWRDGAAVISALHLPGHQYSVQYGPVQVVVLGLQADASALAYAAKALGVAGARARCGSCSPTGRSRRTIRSCRCCAAVTWPRSSPVISTGTSGTFAQGCSSSPSAPAARGRGTSATRWRRPTRSVVVPGLRLPAHRDCTHAGDLPLHRPARPHPRSRGAHHHAGLSRRCRIGPHSDLAAHLRTPSFSPSARAATPRSPRPGPHRCRWRRGEARNDSRALPDPHGESVHSFDAVRVADPDSLSSLRQRNLLSADLSSLDRIPLPTVLRRSSSRPVRRMPGT